MTENIDLFHHALTLLSTKHDLKMSTPATSVSEVIPPSTIARQYHKNGDAAAPRASNRKYVLPKDVAEKEFYQCMVCKERRSTNSFGSVHTHDSTTRPSIRWYCPLCDSFFAVTHRGYHVKSRHSDILTIAHSEPVVAQQSSPAVAAGSASLKRGSDARSSDEDDCEIAALSPACKMQHTTSIPSPSAVSVESVGSCCCSNNDGSDEGYSPSVDTMLYYPDQQVVEEPENTTTSLFFGGDDQQLSDFTLQNNGGDLFSMPPASPFSL